MRESIENLKKLDTIRNPHYSKNADHTGNQRQRGTDQADCPAGGYAEKSKVLRAAALPPLRLSKKLAGKEQKPRFEKPPKETMSALAQLAKEQKLPVRVASVNIFEEE